MRGIMPITKRTRYEVLKRDNHTCRYCGGTAPDVVLTVDHVTPLALGGSDKPDNLVAACKDCNAGKASSSPDSSLVADVRDDALRHAELVRQAYGVLVQRMGERDEYIEEFENNYVYGMPDDWRNSVGRWFEMGVPIEVITDAAQIACSKVKTFRGTDRFAYMCGIIWSQITAVDTLAEAHRYIEGAFMSGEELTNVRIDAYEQGYESGANNERHLSVRLDPLSRLVDHIEYPPTRAWGVPA